MHAIGVLEEVTLLEFEEPSGEQQQPTPKVQEVQPSEKCQTRSPLSARTIVRAIL
jgi:hypothetical protein